MSFLDVCFQVTFLDDVWSDSGVSGTPKTSIWLERGYKNKCFTEVVFSITLLFILEVILEAKAITLGPWGASWSPIGTILGHCFRYDF